MGAEKEIEIGIFFLPLLLRDVFDGDVKEGIPLRHHTPNSRASRLRERMPRHQQSKQIWGKAELADGGVDDFELMKIFL